MNNDDKRVVSVCRRSDLIMSIVAFNRSIRTMDRTAEDIMGDRQTNQKAKPTDTETHERWSGATRCRAVSRPLTLNGQNEVTKNISSLAWVDALMALCKSAKQ